MSPGIPVVSLMSASASACTLSTSGPNLRNYLSDCLRIVRITPLGGGGGNCTFALVFVQWTNINFKQTLGHPHCDNNNYAALFVECRLCNYVSM